MALYEKMLEAWNNRDVEAYWACLHDEWEMTWHSTGKVTNKTSMSAEQMKMIMENADIKDRRCIYENDDILVQHMRADYPNGTKDATMHVSLKKDGLLWRSETGVTAVKTQSQLILIMWAVSIWQSQGSLQLQNSGLRKPSFQKVLITFRKKGFWVNLHQEFFSHGSFKIVKALCDY